MSTFPAKLHFLTKKLCRSPSVQTDRVQEVELFQFTQLDANARET